jgi:hypothetical protein
MLSGTHRLTIEKYELEGCVWNHGCALECIHLLCSEIAFAPSTDAPDCQRSLERERVTCRTACDFG